MLDMLERWTLTISARQYELLRHNVKYRRVTELTSILSKKVTIGLRILNVFSLNTTVQI